ncbi:MAG: hypothetical protein K9M96_08795, partial [Deltaproteobacteria bacterium]|nr:hypothetical protein [Deltaproteobacteria bacterium]
STCRMNMSRATMATDKEPAEPSMICIDNMLLLEWIAEFCYLKIKSIFRNVSPSIDGRTVKRPGC